MSLRVAYWTSGFDPSMEAVSSEVDLLHRSFPGSVTWGLSHRRWCLLAPRDRRCCFHPRLHQLFRGMTRCLESRFDLNHVFGSLGDWFYLEGRRRKPIVLTVATLERPVERSLLERVRKFVVEFPRGRQVLEDLGVESSRIRLIFPPVDLDRFRPSDEPAGRFTVMFASSPERNDWLESRGVPLLFETAVLCPGFHFRLLWRPWGESLATVRRWVHERGLDNVEIVPGRIEDMSQQYCSSHVTVAPFVRIENCKPMPNSLLESMASGRPVLTTKEVGLAELLEEERAGLAVAPHAIDLAEALDRLRSEWSARSRAARATAEKWFSQERFLRSYECLYNRILKKKT